MNLKMGYSTNCFPEASAEKITKILKRTNCNTLDLRVGKGQTWEDDGIKPFLDHGLSIAFIGFNIILGDPRYSEQYIQNLIEPFKNFSIKVVASKECMAKENIELTIKQTNLLKEIVNDKRIFIETHHGFADVDNLLHLCGKTGTNILVDLFGLLKITNNLFEDSYRISSFVKAIQIKGFDWDNPYNSKHLPLRSTNHSKLLKLLEIFKADKIPITLESRSPTYIEDSIILKGLLEKLKDRR